MDECSDRRSRCPENTDCINSFGSFHCKCSTGFQLDDDGNCINIDECQIGSDSCRSSEVCRDTQGSYDCQCAKGYLSSLGVCVDLNECREAPCGAREDCVNSVGSYSCQCKDGYELEDGGTCVDIDECTQFDLREICDANTNCVNNDGHYDCFCAFGYHSVGSICTDINECVNNPCQPRQNCINVPGSYHCNCQAGYIININPDLPDVCVNIDECTDPETYTCRPREICADTDGSYECVCKAGYTRVFSLKPKTRLTKDTSVKLIFSGALLYSELHKMGFVILRTCSRLI